MFRITKRSFNLDKTLSCIYQRTFYNYNEYITMLKSVIDV